MPLRLADDRFPPEVITVTVRWYLRYGLSHMRGLTRLRSARVISAGHAVIRTSAAATTNSARIPTHGIGFRPLRRTRPRHLMEAP